MTTRSLVSPKPIRRPQSSQLLCARDTFGTGRWLCMRRGDGSPMCWSCAEKRGYYQRPPWERR